MKRGLIFLSVGLLLLIPQNTIHAQLASSPWPMFHRSATHVGGIWCSAADRALLAWSYAAGDALLSSPAIGIKGDVCFGSYDNRIYSLASNGMLLWSYSTSNDIFSSPAIAYDGAMYVGSADNTLYAVSCDGSLLWSYSCSDEVNSSPTIGMDGRIYVGSNDEMLYAFVGQPTVTPTATPNTPTPICRGCPHSPNDDGEDVIGSLAMDDSWSGFPGTFIWSYSIGRVLSSPTIGEYYWFYSNGVYTGSYDNNIYLHDDASGFLRWSYATGDDVISSPSFVNYTSPDSTEIYVGSCDNNIYALNSHCTLLWSYITGGDVASSLARGARGCIYVGSFDNNVYALSVGGVLKWSYATGDDVFSSPAVDMNERVYVGSYDNAIYAFDSKGSLQWSYGTGADVVSSPSIDSEGRVYIASADNVLYAFMGPDTPTPTQTPTQTPIPPLAVRPGALTAGQNFSVYLALTRDVTQAFDFYLLVDTPAGDYTLYSDGRVAKGIMPIYKNVRRFTKDYVTTVRPKVTIPESMKEEMVIFYAAFIQAGKTPPVKKLSDLIPTTPYVILMAKAKAMVGPWPWESSGADLDY